MSVLSVHIHLFFILKNTTRKHEGLALAGYRMHERVIAILLFVSVVYPTVCLSVLLSKMADF